MSATIDRQEQTVFDGGACVIEALYDPSADRIVFFASNGYA